MKTAFSNYVKKFSEKKYSLWIILGAIIALQLFVAAFYMNIKPYFNCDELFCYEGAHNVMLYPFNENGLPYRLDHSLSAYYQWTPKDEFMHHFEVRGDEKLLAHSLSDIRQNIKNRTIYYIMLNVVLSFWPNTDFTKWSGYALNAIIFVIHQIVLYLIGTEVFKDKKKAMLPMILYGFSAGGITTIVFIRFYLFMSFLCMLMVYSHLRMFKHKRIRNIISAYAVTAITTLCFYVNQPYILLYAACVVFVFCIICLIEKAYKFLLMYIGIGCAGAVVTLLLVPSIISRIRSMAQSSFGVEAIDSFFRRPLREYAHYIKFFFMKTLSHVTAGVYGIMAVVLLLLIVWLIQGRKKIQIVMPGYVSIQALYIAGVSACYFLINTRIQYDEAYRYMTCIYAGLSVVVAVMLEWIMECCKICYRGAVFCAIIIVGLIIPYWREYVDEVYPELVDAKKCLEEYEGVNSIFVKPKDSVVRLYFDGTMINDGTRFYLMEPDDMETADYSFLEEEYDDGILCWIPITWDEEEAERWVLDQIIVHTELKEYDKLFETDATYGSSVYYIH